MDLALQATRYLFFTGKGGVGKTSVACATAIALSDQGRRVLLVSTDPASNLDEALETRLGLRPSPVEAVPGLAAMNIDPAAAAEEYRRRIVAPYRTVLPDAAVASIEEQLSGACTVEIAAFDEFARLLGDPAATAEFDHVVFDTAPTGHTLRLLQLPAAWSGFLDTNASGTSCLGPLAGLQQQRTLYESTLNALTNAEMTTLVLVTRPEQSTMAEAERTRKELAALGVRNQRLVVNGVFRAANRDDAVARSLEARGEEALDSIPALLAALPSIEIELAPFSLVGVPALRQLLRAPEWPTHSVGARRGCTRDGVLASNRTEPTGCLRDHHPCLMAGSWLQHDDSSSHPQFGSVPVMAPLRIAATQPTPACTEIASLAQFLAHAPHSMQASRSTMRALRSSTAKTQCGQTVTHILQPLHLVSSKASVTTLERYRSWATLLSPFLPDAQLKRIFRQTIE